MTSKELKDSSEATPRFFYGYIVVMAAFFIMVIAHGTYNAFGIFFKPLLTDFGWTRAMTSGAFSLSMIMSGLLAIVMGRLTDRFGPRMVITLCGFLLGLGYLLTSRVSTIQQLYLFYGVIIGAGMGGAYVPLLSTVARWFFNRRGLMTGIVLAGMGLATLIAPPIANQIISNYGWRKSYIILGTVVLAVIVLAAQLLRRNPTQAGHQANNDYEAEERGLVLATGGSSLREAVGTRQFWMVFTMFFCLGFSVFAIIVHVVPHATDLGIPAAEAASILATMGGFAIAGLVVLGSAVDKIGNRRVFIIGFILMAVSLFWLTTARDVWMLYLLAAGFGFGEAGCSAAQSPLVAELFGLRSHGSIFGAVDFGFTLGAAAGPFVAGYAFDVFGSYQVVFLVGAALAVTGIILTTLLMPMKKT